MATYQIISPAKLNLYLDVLKKRTDGYHDIITLFERIDLHDTIRFSEAKSGIAVTGDCRALPCGKRNLAYKAASVLMKKIKAKRGVSIFIKKRIPVSAGMGGGSSNAAAVLLGLDRLWKLGMPFGELLGIAKGLGADVPFFLYETRYAIGRGRGDLIEPLPIKSGLWHILVNPGVGVSTKKIYSKVPRFRSAGLRKSAQNGLTGNRGNVNIYDYLNKFNKIEEIQPIIFNRLKAVALNILPDLKNVEASLSAAGAKIVSMSGSGPTFFAIAGDKSDAARIKKRIPAVKGWRVFTARTF